LLKESRDRESAAVSPLGAEVDAGTQPVTQVSIDAVTLILVRWEAEAGDTVVHCGPAERVRDPAVPPVGAAALKEDVDAASSAAERVGERSGEVVAEDAVAHQSRLQEWPEEQIAIATF